MTELSWIIQNAWAVFTLISVPIIVIAFARNALRLWYVARHDKFNHNVDRLLAAEQAHERQDGSMVRGAWQTELRSPKR